MAKQYFACIGQPRRYKVLSREIAYHGTTMGALAITGLPDLKAPFEPLPPGGVRVPNTNFYRAPGFVADDVTAFGRWAADEIERAILREGPESVAAVYLEAGAELRWLLPAAARLLRAGPRDLRSLRGAARLRRGHLRVRAGSATTSARSATATSRT